MVNALGLGESCQCDMWGAEQKLYLCGNAFGESISLVCTWMHMIGPLCLDL